VNILALDTAGQGCSVALLANGAVIERLETEPRRHAASLLPMVEACLAEAGLALADLDAVAFGRGPGSFTGLRIATSVAQGIAFGADLPVVPVSNLAATAAAALRLRGWRRVLVALDARMDEVYAAAYALGADGLPVLVGEEALLAPAALARPGEGDSRADSPPAPGEGEWRGVGSAFAAWPDLGARLGLTDTDAGIAPLARDLLGLATDAVARGAVVTAEEALPVYLRERVAWQGGGQPA
jgi:tRNA threonylcarbamoyladenosine biosynthesis protein TsaB